MDKSSLVQQQTTMGLYLRDPEHNAPPTEMDPARAQVYRDLVFANLSSLLSGTFPVLVTILGDEDWRSLVRIFLRDYRARTPKFGEIAQEFVEFLASEPLALVDGPWPPFMVELAHYEWVEMALQQSDAEPVRATNHPGALLARSRTLRAAGGNGLLASPGVSRPDFRQPVDIAQRDVSGADQDSR